MANIDIPHRAKQGLSRPNIHIHDSSEYSRPWNRPHPDSSNPSPTSIPVSIPGARTQPPPPLPPPKHLENPNLIWELENKTERGFEWDNSSIPPSSSLYRRSMSGFGQVPAHASDEYDEQNDRPRERRESSISTITGGTTEGSYPKFDEGLNSLSSLSSVPLQSVMKFLQPHMISKKVCALLLAILAIAKVWTCTSKAGILTSYPRASFKFSSSMHNKFQPESSSAKSHYAKAYDQSLLSRLSARRGSDNTIPPRGLPPMPLFSQSANDPSSNSRTAALDRYTAQLKPLSLPIQPSNLPLTDSPSRRWDSPSAISPFSHFSRFEGRERDDDRSPSNTADSERSPRHYRRPWGSGSTGKSDERVSPDSDHPEEAGFRRLHIEDYSTRTEIYSPGTTIGQKRRAESPLGDEGPPVHAPRYYPHSNSGSISSTASGPRSNSYASSLSIAPSSITSAGSYGRISPGGVSPGDMEMLDSPYLPAMALNPSPRGSMQRSIHQRGLSSDTRPMMTTRKPSESISSSVKGSTGVKIQGVFLCECCPKKPKKFDSQEELR
jgi:hypothetical protein